MLVKVISNEEGLTYQVQFIKTDREPMPADFKVAIATYLKRNYQMNENKIWENISYLSTTGECIVDIP